MHSFSDLIVSIEGTYLILSVVYFVFFVLSALRIKHFLNHENEHISIIITFYCLILLHCIIRVVCFIVSLTIIFGCGEEKNYTSYETANEILLFLLIFPDISFTILLFLLYCMLAFVIFMGHNTFLPQDEVKYQKKIAKIVGCILITLYILIDLILMICFARNIIKKEFFLTLFSISDFVFPFIIIYSEIKLHQKTSGLPYQSTLFKNTKNHLNLRIFYWIFARIFHSIITLILMKVNDLNNFVEMPNRTENVENYIYFMMIGSLFIIFCDKIIVELLPLYLVINQDFIDLFICNKEKIENLVHASETDIEEENKESWISNQKENNHIDFSILNLKEEEILNKRKWKINLGVLKTGYLKNEFLFKEEILVRLINLVNVSPYIIESIKKDALIHQKLQKTNNISHLIGYSIEKNTIALIYKKYHNGSLYCLLHKDERNSMNRIDLQLKIKIAINIAAIMKDLHERSPAIIHGHLTSNNILLDQDFNVKISDLLFYDLKKYSAVVFGYNNKSEYTAPEILKENGLIITNPKIYADIYSFGIILWEIFTERIPFDKIKLNELKKIILEDDSRPLIPEDIEPEIALLIRCCWQSDAIKRPSFSKILERLEKVLGEKEVFESFYTINPEI